MKMSIEVNLGTLDASDLTKHLTPEDWREIAKIAVARIFTDPKAFEAEVDARMAEDYARIVKTYDTSPAAEWALKARPQHHWETAPAKHWAWEQERQRRMSESPLTVAILAARQHIGAQVASEVTRLVEASEPLKDLVREAVRKLDVAALMQRAIMRAFTLAVRNEFDTIAGERAGESASDD